MAARRNKWRIHEAPSMSSRDSTPVFVETNLGTRFVVTISADISTKDFKAELERVHLNCFPVYGSIKIDAMMVKRRSCYYYLPDSLPLNYAFQDSSVHWFLRILVHMPNIDNRPDSFKCNDVEVISHNSTDHDGVSDLVELGCSPCEGEGEGDTNIIKCQRKKCKVLTTPYRKASLLKMPAVFNLWRKRKKNRKGNRRGPIKSQRLGYNSRPLIAKDAVTRAEAHKRKGCVEALTEELSETVSVSGIIHKYFSDCDEVISSSRFSFTPVPGRQKDKPNRRSKNSNYSNIQSDLMSPMMAHKLTQVPHMVGQEKPDSKALREKRRKPEVGKRVVLVSNNLGLTRNNEHPALSVCKLSEKKSDLRLASMARTLIFQIPDESD